MLLLMNSMSLLAALSWVESVDNMLIREVADPNTAKLFSLAELLLGLANDNATRREYSMTAFIKMAQDMGIMINAKSLSDLAQTPPLSNIIQPINPGDTVIKLKDEASDSTDDLAMPVDRAQDVVASAAKRAAAKRD
jgi:hypothetical protein